MSDEVTRCFSGSPASARAVRAVCQKCQGAGYLRSDVPWGHPLFGKPILCVCLRERQRVRRYQEMLALCERAGFQREKRLETYQPQVKGVRQAYQATQRLMSQLEHWADVKEKGISPTVASRPACWLVLVGPVGTGKTHLMMAVGNAALDADIPTLFAPVPDLLDYLRQTFDPRNHLSYEEFFERLKSIDLLLLDDLGTEASTPWANEKLFQLLNARYVKRLPTVITLNSQAWALLDERLQSRLSDADLVEILHLEQAQDYRRRPDSSEKEGELRQSREMDTKPDENCVCPKEPNRTPDAPQTDKFPEGTHQSETGKGKNPKGVV
jgi:DNA replication protein DnaC